MNCPNCGTKEKVRVRICGNCSHEYSSKDLMELRQVEYLVHETKSWNVAEKLRLPYIEKLAALKERILPTKQVEEKIEEPIPVRATVTPVVAEVKAPPKVKPPKPKPPKEKVPFDQWLLSERNIKFALYAGAGLLVLAGIIFVGVNWTKIPGPGKFGITLLTSAAMYWGGYTLFQKPAFKLGGNALLGIASGFFALNFAVLQIYVFGPVGFRDDVMWLIASPICMGLYMYTAYLTKSELFTYFSLTAFASTIFWGLIVADTNPAVWVLTSLMAIFALQLLILPLKDSPFKEYTVTHLDLVTTIGMPLAVIIAFITWNQITGCADCESGYPWVVLLAFTVGVTYYAFVDFVKNNRFARWIWAFLLVMLFGMIFTELEFDKTAMGISMMMVSIAYLVAGFLIDQRINEDGNSGAPLYWLAYGVAGLVTLGSMEVLSDLANVLLADVALLGITAYFRKEYQWVYAAVWLFIAPFYLYISEVFEIQYLHEGLLMGGLGLIYCGIGYYLGRKQINQAWPFLIAAAFLSVVVVMMTWQFSGVVTIVLLVAASLYTLAAIWLDNRELLLVGLGALSLAVFPLNEYFELESAATTYKSTLISYGILGTLASIGGVGLSKSKHRRWRWPLYVAAVVDLGGSYAISLVDPAGWYAISFSGIAAALLLYLAWQERQSLAEAKLPRALSFLGMTVIALGHFYLLGELLPDMDMWPLYTVIFSGIMVAGAWFIQAGEIGAIYAPPLRFTGLALGIVPLWGVFVVGDVLLSAIVYLIAAVILLVEALVRKLEASAYVGTSLMILSYIFFINEYVHDLDYWPLYTVVFGSMYVVGSWFLRTGKLAGIYANPLRWTGLALISLSTLTILISGDSLLSAIVYGLAAAIALTEAGVRKLPLMTYIGAGLMVISYGFLLNDVLPNIQNWPPMLAFISAVMVFVALQLRNGKYNDLFSVPFRSFGLYLLILPLLGAFSIGIPVITVRTFAIAGTILLADALARKLVNQVYLAGGAYIVTIWATLDLIDVTETQAYVIPLGLALIAAGWYERMRMEGRFYLLFTIAGLVILLGSAFIQSLPDGEEIYAWLLALESVMALWWGITTKSRGYVQLGGVALVANALFQFGPGFADLDRWIQLGTIGSFLLGIGMLALFKREEMLRTREKISQEWKGWNP